MTEWRRLLVCPETKRELVRENDDLVCAQSGRAYPTRDGVCYFLDPAARRERLDTADGAVMTRGYRRPSRLTNTLRRIVTSEYFPGRAWRDAKAKTLAGDGLKLVIGSGVTQYPHAVHLDLDDFPGVDVVADAAALPFRDGSFDAVLCEVVLEHVAEPTRVIAETHRALKPGGRFFFIAPFLFPYHGHPADYRRWSRDGLLREFSAFDALETGIHAGPCSGMVNLATEWLYVCAGLKYPRGYTLVKGAATAVLFPFKFLDWVICRFPEAHRLAATLYITGVKK